MMEGESTGSDDSPPWTRVDIAQKLVFTEITNIQGSQGIRTSTNEDLAGSS